VIVDIGVPAVPPAAVLEQVEAARQRMEQLARDDRELHFYKDEAANRVVVEVRDLAGALIRTIPPSSALAIMSGEEEA
jgi:flagellar protein FlaG